MDANSSDLHAGLTGPTTALMAGIRSHFQPQLAAAVKASGMSEALLAALVGNETGGKPADTRFEPAVYKRLEAVILGSQPHFMCPGMRKPLTLPDLLAYASPGELQADQMVSEYQGAPFMPLPPGMPPRGLVWGLKRLTELATSFGLTQIMGWHLVEMAGYGSWKWTVTDLQDSQKNLFCAVALASYFVDRYQLSWDASEEILRCWNTGTPDGTTFDPQYVPNGLARMAAYQALAAPPSA